MRVSGHRRDGSLAVEIDQRMEAFYRAYYSRSDSSLEVLRARYGVDYLVVDRRDFGPEALRRARYFEPWGSLCAGLLTGVDASTLPLAHPPTDAVVFQTADQYVLDLPAYLRHTEPGPAR